MNTTAETKPSIIPVFLTVFFDLVGLGIIIPVIAPLLLDPSTGMLPADMTYGTKSLYLGFLIASYPLAQFFGAPILGALSDRHGRKGILTISLVGTCIGYAIFAWGITQQSILILFLSRMLDGFTGGNLAIIQSSISDLADPKNRTKFFGLIGMAFGLGFILGPYIGGRFSDPDFVNGFNDLTGWNVSRLAMPFWFATLLSLFNIWFVQKQFRETLKHKKDTPINAFTGFVNIGKALQMKNLRILFLIAFLYTLGFNFYTQFFNVFLIRKFRFTETQIGDFFAWIGICGALVQGFIVRTLAKKYKQHQLLKFSLIIAAVGILMQIFPDQKNYLYWMVPIISIGTGMSFPNLNSLISMQAGPQAQGQVFGINQSIQSIALAAPPIISGYITNIDMNLPIIVSFALLVLAWILFNILYKPDAPQSKFN